MKPEPLTIIIPTRNRIARLQAAISSIQREEAGPAGIRVTIVSDGDQETAMTAARDARIDRVLFTREHRGSVYARNLATAMTEGALIYATDDLEFKPGAIAAALALMQERHQDGDGVVGFYQGDGRHSPTGVALVGQAFLRRYPGKKLFYPGYFHFSCQEIDSAASSLGKLDMTPAAAIVHKPPKLSPEGTDRTHVEARIHRARDLELSKERRHKNLIWGLTDFEEPK